jgi:hypothetical protein
LKRPHPEHILTDINLVGYGDNVSHHIKDRVEELLLLGSFTNCNVSAPSSPRVMEPHLKISGDKQEVENLTEYFKNARYHVVPNPID